MINLIVRAGDLKHAGVIQKPMGYSSTGQPGDFSIVCPVRVGLDEQGVISNNEDGKNQDQGTLKLFTRYDARVEKGQVLFIFKKKFLIGEIENVAYANRRLNFSVTEL